MEAVFYTRILKEGLLPAASNAFGEIWTLQQDNAPTHTATHTKNWLDAHDAKVLKWSAVSPVLNNTKIVWGMVVWLVYKGGATYDTVQLTKAIFKCRYDIDVSFIQNLYESIFQKVALLL